MICAPRPSDQYSFIGSILSILTALSTAKIDIDESFLNLFSIGIFEQKENELQAVKKFAQTCQYCLRNHQLLHPIEPKIYFGKTLRILL
jgi:hypothetical protein